MRLHGAGKGVDMAVGVFTWENILACCEWVEVPVVGEIAGGEVAIAVAGAAAVGDEEVLGQRVGLIPAEGIVGVRAGVLLVAGECAWRHKRQCCVDGCIESGKGSGVAGELMGVEQADGDFVVGVCGKAVSADPVAA